MSFKKSLIEELNNNPLPIKDFISRMQYKYGRNFDVNGLEHIEYMIHRLGFVCQSFYLDPEEMFIEILMGINPFIKNGKIYESHKEEIYKYVSCKLQPNNEKSIMTNLDKIKPDDLIIYISTKAIKISKDVFVRCMKKIKKKNGGVFNFKYESLFDRDANIKQVMRLLESDTIHLKIAYQMITV